MCRAPTNCWASVRGRHRIADSPYWRTSAGSPKAEQFGVWEMNEETPWQRKFRRRGVLTDHELDALRGIERRLRWESPELIRLFNSVEPQPAKPHCKRARTRMPAAAVAGIDEVIGDSSTLAKPESRSPHAEPAHTHSPDR